MAGGLKALYTLEAGILLDTGVTGNDNTGTTGLQNNAASSGGQTGTGSQLFSRQAFVGLSSDIGSFTLGRQYSGSYLVAAGAGNAMGSSFYGGSVTLVGLIGMPTRANNSMVYQSPEVAGMKAYLTYTTGSENNVDVPTAASGSTALQTSSSGSGYDAALFYTSGKFSGAITTWNVANASYAATETGIAQKTGWQMGANYDFGMAKIYATAANGSISGGNYENVTKTRSQTNAYSISAMVPIKKDKFYVSFTNFDDQSLQDKDAQLIGLGWSHNLDDRTIIYASYGQMQNASKSSYSLTDGGNLVGTVPVLGYSPTSFEVGINMSF